MSVTREQLAAYADGELDDSVTKEVEAELQRSPGLWAQLAAHRTLKARLAAHFASIAEQPVPERLIATVRQQSGGANLIEFKGPPADRSSARSPRRWTWLAAPALAASVALAVFSPGSRQTDDYASGELARALDQQLVATQPSTAPVRILLSFRSDDDRYCRAFSAASVAGIACRGGAGWRLEERIAAGGKSAPEYRPAGSGAEDLMAAVQEMAAGPALDAAEELRARTRGWRPE
jgi:hypothetical protein